jgi:hypothetical protein
LLHIIENQLNKKIKFNIFSSQKQWIVAVFAIICLFSSTNLVGKTMVDLYGHAISLNYSKVNFRISSPISASNIQQNIQLLPAQNIQGLLEELDVHATAFGMDDMAYLLLIKKVSEKYYGQTVEAKIFQYILLKQKGYRTILGFSEDQLTAYAHLDFKVHNVLFVTHKGLIFTDVSFAKSAEPCIEALLEPSESGRAITMNEKRPPFYNALESKYQIYFEFEGMLYQFQGKLNQSLVAYYKEIPDVEFGQVYLNYQLSDKAKQGLIKDLKSATNGMFSSKKIDFLLQFAQNAFIYKADLDAFGSEKFAFPEEILANDYADCEDKSVMFAYLAKEVLELPSVALIYYLDHHLNVGVAFNHKTSYNFIYNNQKYLVCEPSGLGFKPGDNVYDVKRASIVNW